MPSMRRGKSARRRRQLLELVEAGDRDDELHAIEPLLQMPAVWDPNHDRADHWGFAEFRECLWPPRPALSTPTRALKRKVKW